MNFMKFLLSQHFFDILFLNIWWTVAQNPTKHTIFWRSMMRPFRWISMNCFNRFRFLAEVSTNLHKMHYFVQFKLCLWYSFLYLKNVKIHFHGSPLCSILVCKIPEFWSRKLWDQNFVQFDSGNINIKENKKPGFAFSIGLRTKFVWSHGLLMTDFETLMTLLQS